MTEQQFLFGVAIILMTCFATICCWAGYAFPVEDKVAHSVREALKAGGTVTINVGHGEQSIENSHEPR